MIPERNFNPSVYFILDPLVCNGRDVADVAQAAIRGGITMLQYRDKNGNRDLILHNAKLLRDVTAKAGIPLIINDSVEVAKAVSADGVHLGQGDLPAEAARMQLGPDAIIGVTAFEPAHFQAIDRGVVDYVGTGPVFPTKTKPDKKVLGPEGLRILAKDSAVPVVAIGGMSARNARQAFFPNVRGVAVMRAIGEAPDPEAAARAFVANLVGVQDAA